MRTFKTEAIIIKRKNYGEADRILTVLTKYHGKIQVRASGIRRIPSRRSAHVELLNYSMLSLYRGRNIPILTEAQTIDNFSDLKNNLQTIGDAYHLCELIDGLCPENQENSQVFDLLKDTLNKLSFYCHPDRIPIQSGVVEGSHATGRQDTLIVRDSSTRSFIRDFEIELLTTLGYLPAGRQGWSKSKIVTQNLNTRHFIENILERKLKSHYIFQNCNKEP